MSQSPSGETKPETTDLEKAQTLINAIQAGDAEAVLSAIKALKSAPSDK